MSTNTQLMRDNSGATAIEYGLTAAGIAVAIIAVVQGVGTKLKSTFQAVSDNLKLSIVNRPIQYSGLAGVFSVWSNANSAIRGML